MSKEQNGCGCGNSCGCNGENHGQKDHQCGGHGEHNHGEIDVIYLETTNGEEIECQVLGRFPLDEVEYIALLPKEGETVYLYGFSETEEGPELSQIEDDNTYSKVSEEFMRLCDETVEI